MKHIETRVRLLESWSGAVKHLLSQHWDWNKVEYCSIFPWEVRIDQFIRLKNVSGRADVEGHVSARSEAWR